MPAKVASVRKYLWLYIAAWLPLVAMYATGFLAGGVSIGLALRNALANFLPDAALGLLVLRVPSILPWPVERKGRFFSAHLGLFIVFLMLSFAGWVFMIALDSLLFTGSVRVQISFRFLPFRIVIDLLIYGTVAGMAYVQEQAERANRAEALRARAALEAMRTQLNPHFIFNTYHAVLGLLRREPAVAESALERLGDLLRFSLRVQKDGVDEVALRDECAFVASYLALEQLRLADRLRFKVETPPATLECLVPTFALQTLVENAIRHAIAPRTAGGLLEIRAQELAGRLSVMVRDEGTGALDQARIEGSGIGLRLLQERLAALYGKNAQLTLRTGEGGTSACLEVPARRAAEREER